MKREELLKSREYYIFEIQNSLFNVIENYRKNKKLNKTQLATKLGFTKGYITQVLNGDFDHKISKLVDLALACNSVPILHFIDLDVFLKADTEKKYYELIPTIKPQSISFEENSTVFKKPSRYFELPITNQESQEVYSSELEVSAVLSNDNKFYS